MSLPTLSAEREITYEDTTATIPDARFGTESKANEY